MENKENKGLDAEFEELMAQEQANQENISIKETDEEKVEDEEDTVVEDNSEDEEESNEQADEVEDESTEEEDESTEEEVEPKGEKDKENKNPNPDKAKEDKEKAKRTQNYLNAQKRIENKKKELEEAEKKGYNKALQENLKGVNPYTNRPIKDDADLQIYLDMRALDDAGKDPVADYPEFVAEKNRKQMQEEKVRNEQQTRITQDINDFSEKYPNINTKELLEDEKFSIFADGKLGNKPLTQIYEDFQKFNGFYNDKVEKESTSKAIKKIARVQASMGTMENETDGKRKSFKDMSDEEFEAARKNIMKNFGNY